MALPFHTGINKQQREEREIAGEKAVPPKEDPQGPGRVPIFGMKLKGRKA